MTCPWCQAENRDGARFCRECGATFGAVCSGCGAKVEAGSKFCDSCGAPLAATPAQPTAPRRFASPESYTPKHLAEKILTSKSALEGERKQVTVLFADLKGSMELLADRDPEEARRLLDPVLERMMEAVHRYEGTVNQVMGDGIMALFGAPVAHEDHGTRACYAALRMQESVGHYAEELRRSQGADVQIRVGLNSGEVVVRSIGSDLNVDYSAVGQTTHLAGRLEQLARPGATLITAETLKLAEGYIKVNAMGLVPIKGLADPVEVFELVGGGIARRRFEAVAARGLTRFVGRRTEVDVLATALDRARTGHGQIVAPVGEPGVGKSRLFWEFTHSYRTHGCLVVEGGAVSYGKATPYLPVVNLLKGYFQIDDRDDARRVREKVTGKLLTLDRILELTVPVILALLDVPVDDPEWQALDPPQQRQRTLAGIKRILLGESHVQPLVVVIEDLHWIDTATQAFLDSLVESLPTARILLLVNFRPEYEHDWGRKTYYTPLRLDPLPPESAEELLDVLLGDDSTLRPLKQLLIDQTEGNPFFLEESARTLVETRVLVGERGHYRLAKPLESIQVPATVQVVLAARIDRLPSEEKRLLQSASVLGKDVPFALLQAVADLAELELRRALASLQAAEFLYETRFFPDLQYTFKHALTHDVAYGGCCTSGAAPSTPGSSRPSSVCGPTASPSTRSGSPTMRCAARYGPGGDPRAPGRCQGGVAVATPRRGRLSRTGTGGSGPPPAGEPGARDEAIDLRLDLRKAALHPLVEHERIVENLAAAERLAVGLEDPLREARVLGYLSMHFGVVGPPVRALEHAERALVLARQAGEHRPRARDAPAGRHRVHVLGPATQRSRSFAS